MMEYEMELVDLYEMLGFVYEYKQAGFPKLQLNTEHAQEILERLIAHEKEDKSLRGKYPEKFTFMFADEPQYTHTAIRRYHGQDYDIEWDASFVAERGVDWHVCTEEDIADFIKAKNGWVIIQELSAK